MKSILVLIAVSFCCFFFSCTSISQKNSAYDIVRNEFQNPSPEARPKVYWWCLNGNIDTIRVKEELKAMKEAGIGGFDLFEIGPLPEDTVIPAGPAFLSDESLKAIKFAIDEAGKQGLDVGLNLASSWNARGSWTKPENGGKSLYFSKYKLDQEQLEQSIKLPFPEVSFPKHQLIRGTDEQLVPFREDGKPVYYEEIAVLAIPASIEENSLDTAQIIDVTRYFDPETEVLNWKKPQGNWNIYRYICSNSGQQVVLPSRHSSGLTIDHFDSTAVETHLRYIIEQLLPVIGDFRKTALKSFYLASYEARGMVWTSSLANEFKKVNGYDIHKFIPSLVDPNLFKPEITKQIQIDFKKTLSELMINNLYRKSKEICNSYGLKINSEAGGPGYPLYNGPAEPLKAQGTLDIPRGEFWINHSRFYMDENGRDSIDVLRVVKEAAAASHIYQKGIVEEEAFTSFQHWQEGPFDMKPFGDQAFCEGMNKVVFHGFSHNISNSGFPGFAYLAGTHFNDKRVWWPKVKPFIEYLTRISAVAQKTDFVADVLWYYGDKVPNSATPKNTHFKAGPGYDYEVINTEILLNGLTIKDGKLILSNGASFNLLALEHEESIHPEVLKKVYELIRQGAVIVGEKPEQVAKLANYPDVKNENENLLNQIWAEAKEDFISQNDIHGQVWSGITPKEMLKILKIQPDFNYDGVDSYLLDFIHYRKNDLDFYFISNPKNDWISRNMSFRIANKVPEIWDPVSGEIIPVPIYDQNNGNTEIPLTLTPYGSLLVVFKESSAPSHYTGISNGGQHPPFMEFTNDGICLLQDENITMKKQGQMTTIQNENQSFTLDGSWEVSFSKDWGAPEKTTFKELISWTESENAGIKYYSGTATYEKVFQYQLTGKENMKIYIDLGEISKIGKVWLNGKELGITWTKPYRFDVTDIIKDGDNMLSIEISNTWSNRIVGDAISGEKFTNTNITNTMIPAPTIKTGDQTRYPWSDVPLIESGLMGPVSVMTIKPIK